MNSKINYQLIYLDILDAKYPEKKDLFKNLLRKNLTSIDIIHINRSIFNINEEMEKNNQKHRSYKKSDIFEILTFQRNNNYNNSQIAKIYGISRNTIAKWKKIYYLEHL